MEWARSGAGREGGGVMRSGGVGWGEGPGAHIRGLYLGRKAATAMPGEQAASPLLSSRNTRDVRTTEQLKSPTSCIW